MNVFSECLVHCKPQLELAVALGAMRTVTHPPLLNYSEEEE